MTIAKAIERLEQWHAMDADPRAAEETQRSVAARILREESDVILEVLRARQDYAEANPLGGPAKMFRAMAERIEAGEALQQVLADYDVTVGKVQAAEPVATLRVERAKNGRLQNWLDGEWHKHLPEGEYPLYAAPRPAAPEAP